MECAGVRNNGAWNQGFTENEFVSSYTENTEEPMVIGRNMRADCLFSQSVLFF